MSELLNVSVKDPGPEMREQTAMVMRSATELKVVDAPSYEMAATCLKTSKMLIKEIEKRRVEITDPINKGLRLVNAMFKEITEPSENAVRIIDTKMSTYRTEQARIAAEAQRKLDEEARKRREELERQARETKHKAAEKAAAECRAAEEAAAAGRSADAEKLRAQALATEEKAAAKIEEKLEEASMTVAPIVQREVPKVAGHSVIVTWDFEITDASKLPREYMMPDEKKIGKVVSALKASADIPGIRVIKGERQVSRTV